MSAIWDQCYACDKKLTPSPREVWRKCTTCKIWNGFSLTIALIAVMVLWGLFFRYPTTNWYRITNLMGLTSDVVGTWLLATGYIDIMLLASTTWDAGATIRNFSRKNGRQTKAGLWFLVAGFFLQGIANFVDEMFKLIR